MNSGLLIAAIIIIGLILLKIFLKTLKVFLFIIAITVFMIIWWLFQHGQLFR